MKVSRMVHPDEFEQWRREGLALGFRYVASGPLVRSSYKAGEVFMEAFLREREAGVQPAPAAMEMPSMAQAATA